MCSTGAIVAEHSTRLGPCDVMCQNRHNALIHLGHNNGVVTMWTPNSQNPAVKMLCHKGPVRAVAVDRQGRYMTTAGSDGTLKVYIIYVKHLLCFEFFGSDLGYSNVSEGSVVLHSPPCELFGYL